MILKIDETATRDPVIIADVLADYFAGLSSMEKYPAPFLKRHPRAELEIPNFVIPSDGGQPFNAPFSLNELSYAIRKAKGKSAGPDEVGYPMLKNLSTSGKLALLDCINQEWLAGSFPNEWRESYVIPIPKNSGTAHTTDCYRPIALTSCVLKILERMTNRRLIEFLEENKKLNTGQHAFRSGYGTGTYFAALGQIMDVAFACGHHIEIASLDLAKAYNRTWMPIVLQKLADWGVTGNLMTFLKNFLLRRTFRVVIGNHKSKQVAEETGVPQGSVIAVTLFIVYPKDLSIYASDRSQWS